MLVTIRVYRPLLKFAIHFGDPFKPRIKPQIRLNPNEKMLGGSYEQSSGLKIRSPGEIRFHDFKFFARGPNALPRGGNEVCEQEVAEKERPLEDRRALR